MNQEKEIEQKINTWFELHAANKQIEADTFYWSKLWPYVLERFLDKSRTFAGQFETLITLVGFSPEPIILTIIALKPKEVMFIVSHETQKLLDIIVEKTRLKPSQFQIEVVKSSQIEDVYLAIRKFVRSKEPTRIAIDITGGKKSMVGGAAQAAGYLGCAAFYVDNSEYNKTFRKPKPGTEYLNFLKNPYEIFGELEVDRALQLYRAGDYSAAVEIASRLLNRAPELKEVRIYREIFAMHQAWESYLFPRAQKFAQNALEWLERYSLFTDLKSTLLQKKEILQKIIEQKIPWIVLNHYAMARSYARREKFDFAILLLYRTLELLIAFYLKDRYKLDVSNPDYGPFPNILERFNQKIKVIYGKSTKLVNNMPLKIGLMAGATFLSIFDDPLLEGIDLKRIREQADNRNQGILAHGLKPNTKKQFEAMDKEFKPILKRFFFIYFPESSFDKLLLLFKPIAL